MICPVLLRHNRLSLKNWCGVPETEGIEIDHNCLTSSPFTLEAHPEDRVDLLRLQRIETVAAGSSTRLRNLDR
jgi:hypothetical protein